VFVCFNKFWLLAKVYYLDMFVQRHEFGRYLYTCCIFSSLTLLYLSLIADYRLVPDNDRSSPGFPVPDAYSEGRSLSGLAAFWPFEKSLMPD
jgi:hypothetical protein